MGLPGSRLMEQATTSKPTIMYNFSLGTPLPCSSLRPPVCRQMNATQNALKQAAQQHLAA